MHWAFESYFLHRIQLLYIHQKPVSLAREKDNMTRPVSILLEGLQFNILGDPLVTAKNHATFVIQIQRRLRDYLRLLMGRTFSKQ